MKPKCIPVRQGAGGTAGALAQACPCDSMIYHRRHCGHGLWKFSILSSVTYSSQFQNKLQIQALQPHLWDIRPGWNLCLFNVQWRHSVCGWTTISGGSEAGGRWEGQKHLGFAFFSLSLWMSFRPGPQGSLLWVYNSVACSRPHS